MPPKPRSIPNKAALLIFRWACLAVFLAARLPWVFVQAALINITAIIKGVSHVACVALTLPLHVASLIERHRTYRRFQKTHDQSSTETLVELN